MKRKIVCFVALILCLTLGVTAAMADGACGLGDAVVASWDGEAAPQVAVRTGTEDAAVSGAQEVSPAATGNDTTKDFVTRMYRVVLGREPDPIGLAGWTDDLNSGRLTAADLVLGFVFSDEYQKSGKSNAQIVTDLYHAMMDRDPDETGFNGWKKALDVGMTPRSICAGFVGSQEFLALANKYGITAGDVAINAARDVNFELTYFVYRLYQNCLGRTPDVGGLEYWCEDLLYDGTGSDVAYGFIFSDEYYNSHKDNGDYIAMLYNTILGRQMDPIGYEGWKNMLDFTSTREKVLNGFLFSPEFNAQCATAGIYIGDPVFEPDTEHAWRNNVTLLTLVNNVREQQGKPKLHLREDLWADVAMIRTSEIIARFDHTRPDGRSFATAYTDAGIPYAYAGENIAYGYANAQSVFSAWMNSAGHRANILDEGFRDFATGYIHTTQSTYWAQAFMTVKNLK